MPKSLVLVLLPALALGGCSLFGGRSADAVVVPTPRNAPLVIPRDFTLPPPTQPTPSAQVG